MKAVSIKIHNFRTFTDIDINLLPYTLLVGANNAGKSNLIDAIRIFYEKDLKYEKERDFPKFPTKDEEVWIEIKFKPSDEEIKLLKNEYKSPDGTFTVRKYFQSLEKDEDNKNKEGIYAYVGDKLSNSRFYGAKNVQQSKFGQIIYIPAISKLDDITKLTGPSVLRELINVVLKKIINSSPSYASLQKACDTFGEKVKAETTPEGYSLDQIQTNISTEISSWGVKFELVINPISSDDIVKTLIGHRMQDLLLQQPLDPKCYGQGFQRQLIFSLIKVSSQYSNIITKSKSEFSPDFTWLLFEEPEAFLHPTQIEILASSLRRIASNDGSQVLLSTHNPEFVSLNIEELPSIARLYRKGTQSLVGQITVNALSAILNDNLQDINNWQKSGMKIDPNDLRIDMESLKYSLWLDPKRCSAFFAEKILLVEGPTEVALFSYLFKTGAIKQSTEGIFILDTIGKFNIPRFMRLLEQLNIYHAVLCDYDNGKYQIVDDTINNLINPYTLGISTFTQDLETFLAIPKTNQTHRKPQNVLWNISNNAVDPNLISSLVAMVVSLLKI